MNNHQDQRKIKSVLELAKYRVGDTAWWVILRPIVAVPDLKPQDLWMNEHHPKASYQFGPGKLAWDKTALPKLQHIDFGSILSLLTHKMLVEKFIVCDIVRSRNTGEFFYSNDNDEWMPESFLITSKSLANRERSRICKLISKWVNDNK